MSRVSETRRAVRDLFFDVMEQCTRHMEACPEGRVRFEHIGTQAHLRLEEYELRFSWSKSTPFDEEAVFRSAQAQALEWLRDLQDIRKEFSLENQMEHLPTWPFQSTSVSGTAPKRI